MTDKQAAFPVRPMSRQEWDQAPESDRPRAEVWLRQKREFEHTLRRWRRDISSLKGEERLAQQVAWLQAAGQSSDVGALKNAATRLFGEGRKEAKRRHADRKHLAAQLAEGAKRRHAEAKHLAEGAKRAECEAIMAL